MTDLDNILKNLEKYYIYAVSSKQAKLLGASNSKAELRSQAKAKLVEMGKGNLEKYNGAYLFRIKLMRVPLEAFEADSRSQIKMIGGPIVAIVERVLINIGDTIKLKSVDTDSVNNKIYFGQVYLEKYGTIKQDSINEIAYRFSHHTYNLGLFAVNTLND
jgi:hypothetical protein